jgi:hypothetical protein
VVALTITIASMRSRWTVAMCARVCVDNRECAFSYGACNYPLCLEDLLGRRVRLGHGVEILAHHVETFAALLGALDQAFERDHPFGQGYASPPFGFAQGRLQAKIRLGWGTHWKYISPTQSNGLLCPAHYLINQGVLSLWLVGA